MLKLLAVTIAGVALLFSGSLQHQDLPPTSAGPTLKSKADSPSRADPESSSLVRLGLGVKAVPAELGAHLAVDHENALLVTSVQPNSPANDAGFHRHDVIVSVNGKPASSANLQQELGSALELELQLIRAGVAMVLGVEVPPSAQSAQTVRHDRRFFSTEQLAADHPFRRYQAYHALRQTYAGKFEEYARLIKTADQESRDARQEAEAAARELHKRWTEQVTRYLAEVEQQLSTDVDRRLSPELTAPLPELALGFGNLVPEETQEGISRHLASIKESLQYGNDDALEETWQGLAKDVANTVKNQVRSVRHNMHDRFHHRVVQACENSVKEITRHHGRLDDTHLERSKWLAATIAEIRQHLNDRIECAVDRSAEEFGKKLNRRLESMDAPEPGEIDGCMAEVRAQLKAMTERFLGRTEDAVAMFTASVDTANQALAAAAPARLVAMLDHVQTAEDQAESVAAFITPAVANDLSDWMVLNQYQNTLDSWRQAQYEFVNAQRDEIRARMIPLAQSFREHQVVTDDAWSDLRQLLCEIQRAASNDCWKVEGPHLDGRFPRPEADKKRSYKVSMASR